MFHAERKEGAEEYTSIAFGSRNPQLLWGQRFYDFLSKMAEPDFHERNV